MLNRWLRTASPALLLFPAFFVGSDAWMSRGETDEVETPGAVDLTLPGYLGPATNEVLAPNRLAAAVGANVMVNDSTLCPNGRGIMPSATPAKDAIVVNPITGRIHLTYTRFGSPAGIYSTYSDDGGDTWNPQVPVQAGSGVQGSFPALDSQGNLFVGLQSSGSIRVYKSTDGGDSFQASASFPFSAPAVPFMDRSSDFPQVGIDTSGGAYDGLGYVVWHSGVGGWNRPMIAHSEDGGATWTNPMPVNQDEVSAPHWWPSVSVDANGTVNVVYLDRRNNPGTGLTDLYLSQSTDGGYSFTDTQVTDVTSSWQGIRTDPGFTFAGDYLRGVTQGTSLYTVWPDPRNGDPDAYFSRIDTAALAARNNSR